MGVWHVTVSDTVLLQVCDHRVHDCVADCVQGLLGYKPHPADAASGHLPRRRPRQSSPRLPTTTWSWPARSHTHPQTPPRSRSRLCRMCAVSLDFIFYFSLPMTCAGCRSSSGQRLTRPCETWMPPWPTSSDEDWRVRVSCLVDGMFADGSSQGNSLPTTTITVRSSSPSPWC